MPHPRPRYATPIIQELLRHSPIVGVLGQRQTGKTTLSEALSKDYATLDLNSNLEEAEKDPFKFIEKRGHPFTIDECQLAPNLFPALKEQVRTHPRKGQFILTGSVRFTSRKAIRESLTGRIVNLELLPFGVAEAYSEPLPATLVQWMQARSFPQLSAVSRKWIEKETNRFKAFLSTGGLPGICFFREHHVRAPRFETHLETLLERDIRLILNTTTSYRQLRALCTQLALEQGQPLNFSDLARATGITPPSVRKLIAAMEGLFLFRTISTENLSSPVLFFEDQGLASHLISDQTEPKRDLSRGLFSNILPQFYYRSELVPVFSQYRTRGGAKVDISIRTLKGIMGIIPIAEEEATPSSLASARSYLGTFSGAKVIIAHQGSQIVRVSDNILSVPFPLLLSDQWV